MSHPQKHPSPTPADTTVGATVGATLDAVTGRPGAAWAVRVSTRLAALGAALGTVLALGQRTSAAVLAWCAGDGAPVVATVTDRVGVEPVGVAVAVAVVAGSSLACLASGTVWAACRAVRR